MTLRGEHLFDEEAGGRVETVAVGSLGDRKNLVGACQAQLRGEKAQVVLVLSDTMGEDLERQQRLRRGSETAQAGQVEDWRRGGILFLEEALDGGGRRRAPGLWRWRGSRARR